jgi:hypothetical protein
MSKTKYPKLCSTDTSDEVFIKLESTEGKQFIENLQNIRGTTNAPNLCSKCNSFLNYDQTRAHDATHKSSIYRPAEYTNKKEFLILQKANNHVRGEGLDLEIKKIFSKPLKLLQNVKKRDEATEKKASEELLMSQKLESREEKKECRREEGMQTGRKDGKQARRK